VSASGATLQPDMGEYFERRRNFTERHFWARGYCVSTVGLTEQLNLEHLKNPKREEKRQKQIRLAGL
jgi:putative transposase